MRDHDVARPALEPLAIAEVPACPAPQGGISLGRAVLQGGGRVLGEAGEGGLAHLVDGKEFGRRKAAGERYDIGLLGDLEDFPDRARTASQCP